MAQPTTSQQTVIRKRDGCATLFFYTCIKPLTSTWTRRLELFDSQKALNHLRTLSWGLDVVFVNVESIISDLEARLPSDTMDSEAFLIFLAEVISGFSSRHPDYSLLAGRVYACYHHKRVPKRFSTWLLSHAENFMDKVINVVRQHADILDAAIIHHRDFHFTYRALQLFEKSYLLKDGREMHERLQFLFMRVAIGIHGDSVDDVLETYHLLSTRKISFASPALWNGGLQNRHFASCYIYEPLSGHPTDAVTSFSAISAIWAADGGVGISAGDVPATKGPSDGVHPGLMPLLKVYESLASYWSRSTRHRSSSATVYVPIWHSDVRKVVLSRTNRAYTGYRFRHLYPGLWIPHLFMRRVEANEEWSLFDPVKVPSLTELYGDAFDAAFVEYERQGLATAKVSARALWDVIGGGLRESGTPFLMFSDNINAKNNQMNIGIIKSSNLCTEIVQYSSTIESAVCILASLCLPRYILPDGTFDYNELHRVTKIVVRDLDLLIDLACYPTTDAAVSAFRTRSLGIGVQGLADVFAIMEIPFTSREARSVNKRIFETVYHAALESSSELAELMEPYDMWVGSPAYQGVLQVDMWNADTSGHWDFNALRERIRLHGLRNSVLTAQMPTASTAQLFGNSEGIDPYISNITQYRILSGNYNEVCRPLVNALKKRGLWTEQIRTDILSSHGSVQDVPGIPDDLKSVFRTAFELDPHELIEMAAERGPFIDQSQSLSLFLAAPTPSSLLDLQLHAWRSGLKTGAYYVRSKAAADPQPFGVGPSSLKASPSAASTSTSPGFVDPVVCPCDA